MANSPVSLAISGKTQVFGIIGDPIEHSMSPPMQNAALNALGIDGVYVPFRVEAARVAEALTGLWALNVQGFNVTIPHKQAVMAELCHVSDLAQAVGAVNTVWRTAAGWAGTNTDVLGFVSPLKVGDRDWTQSRAVVLGNGGAARAVVAGCVELGCAEIWVVGRDRDRLDAFAASWADSPLRPPLHTALWPDLTALLADTHLLVNTTPIGMSPRVDATPVAADALAHLPATAIAYDLIYTPSPTQFLALATQRGLHTVDGVEMLVQQGAAALTLWTQQPAPVDLMRQVLRSHLGLSPL